MPSAAPNPPRHTLLAELGRGGMATAYLAAVQGPGGFNKLVVIKRLRPALAEEPEFLRMFMEEARLSARIDHPNVVHTNEVGFDGEYHFISMEYLDGQSLESILRRILKNAQKLKSSEDGSPTSEPSALGIEETLPLKFHLLVLTHCLQGLDFAHELKDFDGAPLNVVHRDVSPHNIMVTYDGAVKVLDFGIAKAADSSGDTRTGVMKGKCAYMPAEQFGGKSVDRRADIFAVGVMMWQALTGRKMWRGLSDAEIFQKLATGQIPTVRSVKPDVDAALEAICMKALAAAADDRFATAVEFQTAIEDYVATHPELRATTRDLGKYISDLFSEDRARIRGIIEAELGKESAAGKSRRAGTLPQLALGGATPTNASSSFEVPGPISGTPVSAPTRPSADEPKPASNGRLFLLGGVAVAAVAAIVVAVAIGGKKGATGSPSEQPTASVAAPVSAAPSDVTSSLTVSVKPPDAKVLFDDAPLTNAAGVFKRDGAKHKLRVEAPGYVSHVEWVVLDSSQVSLDVSLEREKADGKKPAVGATWTPPHATAAATTAAPTSQPTTPPTPATTAAPTASTKKPGLDTGDPWAPQKK